MKNFNKTFLIGHLSTKNGSDKLELSELNEGRKAVSFSLATNSKWLDKNTQEMRESVEWHQIVAYDKTAELAQTLLKKGAQVFIEGRLHTRRWVDKQDVTHYTTEIVMTDFILCDKSTFTNAPEFF